MIINIIMLLLNLIVAMALKTLFDPAANPIIRFSGFIIGGIGLINVIYFLIPVAIWVHSLI